MRASRITVVGVVLSSLVVVSDAAAERLDPPFGDQQTGRFDREDGRGGPISYRYHLRARPNERISIVTIVSPEKGGPDGVAVGVHVQWRTARGDVKRASSSPCPSACTWSFAAPDWKEAPPDSEYSLYVRDESDARAKRGFRWLVKAERTARR